MTKQPVNPFGLPPAPDTAAPVAAPPSNILVFDAALKNLKAKERWSGSVMDRGYTMLPTILLWGQAKLGLTADELNVLLQIISHWFYAGNDPHPSKGTIAARMGKHPRTVQDYITSLEKKGFLKRVQRFRASKGQDSNGFDLSGLAAKLEAIAPEFKKVSEQNKNRRRKVEKPAG
ncbi:MAG: helix-turn-helix domain-containing protein [Rhizobiaceae bacterium]